MGKTSLDIDRLEVRVGEFPARGVDRRDFLRALGALGAGTLLVSVLGPARRAEAAPTAAETFPDGIKSGDPRPRQSVIWTRVPRPPSGAPVPVLWEVAEDAAFTRIVAGGLVSAKEADGHTVKVWATPLRSDSWFHYRFTANGVQSVVGRLRTAPLPGRPVDRLRYAFASCQQRGVIGASGKESLYVTHRAIAKEGVDFLMHLGDYIYASDSGDLRVADYRRRYQIFHSNPELQKLQAAVPLIPTWDDGEFYNGVDRLGDPARLAAARQVWFEMMPVLKPRDERIYRTLPWGNLADVIMIDTRMYRDPAVDVTNTLLPGGDVVFDPSRTTLGAAQKQWLEKQLAGSRAAWRFIGSSYNVNPWKIVDYDTPEIRAANPEYQRNAGNYAPNEAWDDYQAERRELLEFLAERDLRNNVFTCGHTHYYLACELQPDFDDLASPTVAFDFTTGSQTADPDPATQGYEGLFRLIEAGFRRSNHPYMKHVNLWNQGYAVVDVTPEEALVHYRVVDTFDPNAEARTYATFRVRSGSRTLETLYDETPPSPL
ncbi:alkaline phosphatase D [Myxococcaceae bacterium]|jgi:alkaline phosphatase D|nr:alkaline phosphatase D [Myxococcaceae bacterium]